MSLSSQTTTHFFKNELLVRLPEVLSNTATNSSFLKPLCSSLTTPTSKAISCFLLVSTAFILDPTSTTPKNQKSNGNNTAKACCFCFCQEEKFFVHNSICLLVYQPIHCLTKIIHLNALKQNCLRY